MPLFGESFTIKAVKRHTPNKCSPLNIGINAAAKLSGCFSAARTKRKGKPVFQDLPLCYAYILGGATLPHLLTSCEGQRLPVPSSKAYT